MNTNDYNQMDPICFCGPAAKFHLTFCGPLDYSMPGPPVFHYLHEFAQICVH